ncbi:MAG: RHS repeat-associated core domain-containing protein, partial [Limisphaerales bacterium]
HGNVRFLMDTNGNITDTYTYDAFGNLLNSTGSTPNDYLYCGLQYDTVSGLYNNRARRMFAPLGRFTTMDTFAGNNEDPLSLHKYLYAADDPVNKTDPTGHDYDAFDINMASIFNYVITSMGDAVPAEETPGLNGPAHIVTSGAIVGGFTVNDYLGSGATWGNLASPGTCGLDNNHFKVQIVAPYSGYETVGVGQTFTPIGANSALLGSMDEYLEYNGQPDINNNETVNEPLLGSDHYTRNMIWFPRYTPSLVTFADAPGNYESGAKGDIQFQTTFYSREPSSVYSRVSVAWTLHVDCTVQPNSYTVSQGSQSEK